VGSKDFIRTTAKGLGMRVRNFRELIAWQKAMDLVESIYRATETFPSREIFGLTTQLRRAAVSVPSNIAEGQGRSTTKDFLHFLSISRGSLQEVQTQIEIARRLNLIEDETNEELVELSIEVARLLNGLSRSLQPPC
jgi:four helix bundle protein